ncbi:MAG: hypothetical protein M0024_10155 [Nitrospiraceae bacterium]|nr:hypothetical protein [Nitrospiraceae bacterium]
MQKKEQILFDDTILVGVLKAFGITFTPHSDHGRVRFAASGDIDDALRRIYDNAPVGARDVLEQIKLTRSAVFSLKGGRS